MTSAAWVFRKHWHPKRQRLARVRALWLVVARHWETEICGRCGRGVGLVWHAPDDQRWVASGYPDKGGGILCIPCFDRLCEESGLPFLRWTCEMDSVMYG